MMRDRLAAALPLLAPGGALAISINEEMLARLKILLDDEFSPPLRFRLLQTVQVRHPDRILKADKAFREVTEFLLLYGMPRFLPGRMDVPAESDERYLWSIEAKGPPAWAREMGGRAVEAFAPGSFTIRRAAPAPDKLKRINIRGTLREGNSSGRFFVRWLEDDFEKHRDWLFRAEGIGADGLGFRWFHIPPAGRRKNGDYFQGLPLRPPSRAGLPFSNLVDFTDEFNRVGYEGGVRFRWGKKPLAFLHHVFDMAGLRDKPQARVLDFFAGSGSTGHAVVAYNARHGGGRSHILIEQADYFDDVLLKRLRALEGQGVPNGSAEP